MNDRTIGRLTPVDLRDIWSSEATARPAHVRSAPKRNLPH